MIKPNPFPYPSKENTIFTAGALAAITEMAKARFLPAEAIPLSVFVDELSGGRAKALISNLYGVDIKQDYLANAYVTNLSMLTRMTRDQIKSSSSNIGKKTLNEISEALNIFGLAFSGEIAMPTIN